MNTELKIIEKNKHWLVIDKPAGISVHNEVGDVKSLLKKQLQAGSYQDIFLVHRLDKETSGLMLIALDQKTAASLADLFQTHQAEKFYYAVLRGPMPVTGQWQEWNQPISDKAEGRKNPQGLSKDRIEAKTLFKVVKANRYFSLIEVRLMTGRQHQIRKHTAMAKHAIVGDSRYGDPKYNSKMAGMYGTDRMYLHAFKLRLPLEGKTHEFSTGIPEEFEELVKSTEEL
ncbi:RluA family pseudouridine synthase [Bdellovibrio bacteriovorus]